MTKASKLRVVNGGMTKQHVLAAVEPTAGMTPSEALAFAMDAPPPVRTRVFASDYFPALEALMRKGYTQIAAARLLVG